MRRAGIIVFAGALAVVTGCADPAATDADTGANADASPDARPYVMGSEFDIDVEVHSAGVRIWLREHFATPCGPEEIFPRPGECTTYTDAFGCSGEVTTCLTRIAIERDGTVLAEEAPVSTFWWHTIWLGVGPELFGASGATLVIEGCGGSVALPLPAEPAPEPVATGISTDGEYLLIDWSSPGTPTGIIAELATGYTAVACHQPATGQGRAGSTSNYWSRHGELYLATVAASDPVVTPWGDAHVWNVTFGMGTPDVLVPTAAGLGSDWWNIDVFGLPNPDSTITVDGVTSTSPGSLSDLAFRPAADGGVRMQFRIQDDWLQYVADDTTDSLRVNLPGGPFVGSFPHAVPVDDLELSFDGNQVVDLVIGPVTLAKEGDPTITRVVTIAASWEHPFIARPIGP